MSFAYNHPSSGLTLVPRGPGGLSSVWSADAITNFRVSHPGTVTEHPVQDGDPLTDHVVLLPALLEIDCIVTDTPTRLFGLGGIDRAIGLANDLLALRNDRTVMDISTSRGVFPGYVIENIEETRTPETGRAIELSIMFKRRRVAKTNLVPADIDADAVALGAGGTQVVAV